MRDAVAKEMPYVQAVFREGLRLFPPAVVPPFWKKVQPGGDELCGFRLPAGTGVGTAAPVWVSCRDEEFWGGMRRGGGRRGGEYLVCFVACPVVVAVGGFVVVAAVATVWLADGVGSQARGARRRRTLESNDQARRPGVWQRSVRVSRQGHCPRGDQQGACRGA